MGRLARSLRPDSIRWLLGLTTLTLCSWARCLGTGSFKIDENYPSERFGTLLLVAMFIGWGLAVSGWAEMVARPPERPRRLAFVGLFVAAWMLPLLSNDIFSLFAHASLSSQGQDVYTSAHSFPSSPWFSWIGERWRNSPSPYGPVSLIAAWPSVLGGSNPWLAELFLKLGWLVPLGVLMEISFRVFSGRPLFHVLLWLNPLFLVEGPGQLHPDLVGVLLITAGLLMRGRARGLGGATAWSLATLSKWNFGFTLPWFWLSGTLTRAQRRRRGALLVLSLVVLGAAFYAPFWRGPATLVGPLHETGPASGWSRSPVVDCIDGAVRILRGDDRFHPDPLTTEAIGENLEVRAVVWQVAQTVMQLLALAAILALARGLMRGYDEKGLAFATGALVVALVTLASPKFQSWYLMSALPFFGLSCPPAWRRWWVWAVAASVSTEFSLALPRAATVFPVVSAVTTIATATVFLGWFRARFWELNPEEVQTVQVVEGASL